MARNALNFFEPYESLPPHHENQLTRALVVVLRLSPMAQAAFLRRVDPTIALHDCEPAEWRVQRRDILPMGAVDPERLRVISVLLSGERGEEGGDVVASQRGQVLDAIAVFGSQLAVVIENKVTARPDDWQARALNLGGRTVMLDEQPRRIRWRDLLTDVQNLLQRRLVGGAEAGIVEDFLEYTEAYFDSLLPYSTLRVCQGSAYRQQRRLRRILTEASGIEARQDRRPSVPLAGATRVDRAYLELVDEEVQLRLWPGDTLQQARALYASHDAIAGLERLLVTGWHLEANFHFGHMAKGLAWTRSSLPVREYMAFWVEEIADAHQVNRSDWDDYWDWLLEHKIAAPEDRERFARDFDNTRRQDATPRPGLRLARSWGLEEAEALDARGALVRAVRQELQTALTALAEFVPLDDPVQGVAG